MTELVALANQIDMIVASGAPIDEINLNLESLWNRTDDEISRAIINVAWENAQALSAQAASALDIAAGAVAAAGELKQQRDLLVNEIESLNDDLDNPYTAKNPKVSGMYENLMEDHNANFWESLPYDMAHVLGWDHMEADLLYWAITYSPFTDEFDHGTPDDRIEEYVQNYYDRSYAKTLEFRAKLREMIKELES